MIQVRAKIFRRPFTGGVKATAGFWKLLWWPGGTLTLRLRFGKVSFLPSHRFSVDDLMRKTSI